MHQIKKQAIYNPKNIQLSRSKSRVTHAPTLTDKVFSWPTWLEMQMDCIEVHYVEACKRARVKAVGHWVIQNPQLIQQLHVGVEVINGFQP